MNRFYYESDGGPGRKNHYVVDRYANPIGDHRRIDVETRALGRALAKRLNAAPERPPWDTIQSERDGYKYTGSGSLCRSGDGDCEEMGIIDGMCRGCHELWTDRLDEY